MREKNVVIFKSVCAFLFCILIGCNVFDSKFEKITKNYYVGWVDDQTFRRVEYSEGHNFYSPVIPSCVEAIGWDKNFIIIQNYMKPSRDTRVGAWYYIIDIHVNETDIAHKKGIWGPYTKDEFQKMKNERSIPAILDFQKKFSGCR